MNCVRCEITRAKIRSALMFNVGYSLDEICDSLNKHYAGAYVKVEDKEIVRFPAGVFAGSTPIFKV